MNIRTNVSLKDFSTMRVGGDAKALARVTTADEVLEAVTWAEKKQMQTIMVGSGSNIVWRDEGYDGLVIVNDIMGFEEKHLEDNVYEYTIGSGENWDSVVARTVAAGMHGIETLSLIPGTAGATPVQNVGAYYQDISDTLVHVQVYDKQLKQLLTLKKDECGLGYRTSRFKTTDRGRFFILSLTLRLTKENPTPPLYPSVQQYFDDHNITEFTPQTLRDAIIAIRSAKLPSPEKVANNGSFFANPLVSQAQLNRLQAEHGSIMHWPVGPGVFKIPAAWLVEHAGFKNYHDPETGMSTWPTQALVLVNEHAKGAADVIAFKTKIQKAVLEQFNISLEQEPELL